jgi:phosphinothricin acetyltransferase
VGQKEHLGMIRAAGQRDVPHMLALWNEMIEQTTDTFTTISKSESAITELIATRPCLVAEVGGRFAGFVTYGPFRSGPGYAGTVEHTILVTRAARGTGTAQRLMDAALTHARTAGCHVMVAGISAGNARALAFHAALGFEEVGRMPEAGRKWDQFLDLVLMQKKL